MAGGGWMSRDASRKAPISAGRTQRLVVVQVAIAMAFLTLAALFCARFWSGLMRDVDSASAT